MANKERANPSSANVITIVRSPLDSLARVALRYIISSAIDRVRRIAADRSAGLGPSRAATPGARAYGDEAGSDSRGTNRVATDASGLVIRPPSASRMTKHLSLWRRGYVLLAAKSYAAKSYAAQSCTAQSWLCTRPSSWP